jgi:hypothetical protein
MKIIFNSDLENIEGHLNENAEWLRPGLEPGTAAWSSGTDGQIAVLRFVCPCGCGSVGTVPVKSGYGTHWTWDGNTELPTLTPSILRMSGCRWHGYLTKGEWVKC